VTDTQILFTALLVGILVSVAAVYAWHQVAVLRTLPPPGTLPQEDRLYLRNQAWRRLVCSGLMVVLAGLLVASFFVEPQGQQLVNEGEAARARNEQAVFSPEQKDIFRRYTWFWISALLVLLLMMGIALYEVIAIRRFGWRHFRKLQEDRRAMIARQVARLRQERNGHA